jgi:hypothetical protein
VKRKIAVRRLSTYIVDATTIADAPPVVCATRIVHLVPVRKYVFDLLGIPFCFTETQQQAATTCINCLANGITALFNQCCRPIERLNTSAL